jgi:hypothetical protein
VNGLSRVVELLFGVNAEGESMVTDTKPRTAVSDA